MADKIPQTRPIVEGALLAAIAVVLIMLGIYIPFLGSLVVFLWPVPVVVIHLRHGFRLAVLTIVVAGLALTALIGPLQAALLVISFGALGLAFGYGLRNELGPGVTLGLGSISVLVSLLITLAVSSLVMNINIFSMIFEALEQSTKFAAELYDRVGVGQEAREMLDAMSAEIPQLRLLLPAVVVTAALFNSLINYQVARGVLVRLGYKVPTLPAFADWKLPQIAVIIFAVLLGVMVFTYYYPAGHIVEQGITNAVFLFTLAFKVHGLALAYWFMTRWQLAKWFRVGACIVIAFSPQMVLLAQWVGIVDVVIDVRQLVSIRSSGTEGESK